MKGLHTKSVFVVIALLVQHVPAIAQTDTLATVYGVPITAQDFIKRWELVVYPGKDRRRMQDSTKMRFLYSMIAEQLLARAPVSLGSSTDSSLESLRKESEETFMRDALFRREVTKRVTVTRRDIAEAVRFSAYRYTIDAFRFTDSLSAVLFFERFKTADSVSIYAALVKNGIPHDVLTVSFGELQEDVERSIFGKQHGFMAHPLRSRGAFAVIRILSRSQDTKYAGMSPPDRLTTLKRKIEERRLDAEGWNYLVEVMRGIRVEVIPEAFFAVVEKVGAILKKQAPNRRPKEYHLTEREFEELQTQLAGRANDTLVRFPDHALTVRQAIAALPYSDFAPKDTTSPSIERSLRGALRFESQNHYLVERARALGLKDDPAVQADVQLFVDANRASDVAAAIRAGVTVTPAECDSFYAVRRNDILREVHLLLRIGTAASMTEAAGMLQRFQAAGTGDLTPPPDTSTVKTRWMRASDLGEYGAALAQLSPGTVYGPIGRSPGYTVFQLLDRKTIVADSSLARSLEEAQRRLLDEKRARVLDEYIAGLAEQAGVRIDRANVAATSVQRTQMYSVRYIGFGGRVNAVPMLPPRETWIRLVGHNTQILP